MSLKSKKDTPLKEFTVLHDNVLVQTVDRGGVSKIINPQSYEDKPEYGIVIKVGSGIRDEKNNLTPLQVKKGDVIYFGKYSSVQTRDGGEDYYIIKEYDIIAKV